MVFASQVFLFCFLPLVLAAYLLTPGLRVRNLILLSASLAFYAWGEGALVLLMVGSIGFNYVIGRALVAAKGQARARVALGLGVALNLALLCAFKYANFLVDNLSVASTALGGPSLELDPVHLPIGISFFTFQAISFLVDVYRGDAEAQRDPLTFGLFIALFPQLIAGPIVRYQEIAAQLTERTLSRSGFANGVERFVIGLAKKVLIANPLSVVADAAFSLAPGELGAGLAWAGALCYTLQIYFDFSGYSDMAIGLGAMFGFKIPENFNYPYVSQSITEFWRRWHITLSTWFRDYLYIPLGGGRVGPGRTYRNLCVVFLLCGLWHGAAWTFVVWGAYHGAFLVFERRTKLLERLPRPVRHLYLLSVVIVGWVFFRAEDASAATSYLAAMAGQGGDPLRHPTGQHVDLWIALVFVAGLVGSVPWLPWLRERWTDHSGLAWAGVCALAALFGLSVVELAASTANPFIYFRF
jgi:alginate O-acetyltransferase complex protein AlgI